MASAYPGITPGATNYQNQIIQRTRKFPIPRTFNIPTTGLCAAKNNERLRKSSKDHIMRCEKLSPNEVKMNRLDAQIKCRNNRTCAGKLYIRSYSHAISKSS